MRFTFIPVLILVLLPSCSRKDARLLDELEAQNWELTRFTVGGEEIDLTVLLPRRVDLIFDGPRAHGHAAVNHYDLECSVKRDGTIRVRGGGMTEMAGPEHLMELDEKLIEALFGVTRFQFHGTTLTLESDSASLEFEGRSP